MEIRMVIDEVKITKEAEKVVEERINEYFDTEEGKKSLFSFLSGWRFESIVERLISRRIEDHIEKEVESYLSTIDKGELSRLALTKAILVLSDRMART